MNPFHRITIFLIVTACIFASGCSKPLLYTQNSVFDLKRGNVWSKLDSLKREPG